MAVRQSRLVQENSDFSTLIGWYDNIPWIIKKSQWGEKALTPIYQSRNFGEDKPISFLNAGIRKSTIKKNKK